MLVLVVLVTLAPACIAPVCRQSLSRLILRNSVFLPNISLRSGLMPCHAVEDRPDARGMSYPEGARFMSHPWGVWCMSYIGGLGYASSMHVLHRGPGVCLIHSACCMPRGECLLHALWMLAARLLHTGAQAGLLMTIIRQRPNPISQTPSPNPNHTPRPPRLRQPKSGPARTTAASSIQISAQSRSTSRAVVHNRYSTPTLRPSLA